MFRIKANARGTDGRSNTVSRRGGSASTRSSASEVQALADGSPQARHSAQVQALADRSSRVQRQASRLRQADGASIHATARAGVSGSGGPLPFHRQVQRAFGRHDISHVRAFTSPRASAASRAIGARAYATGSTIAFADTPSLHTAAHEAAHVVQQQHGVQLSGGVGKAGDTYERHADAVAERVVSGRSAEALLDRHAPSPLTGSANASHGASVQRDLYTLGEMQDDPNHVTLEQLLLLLAKPPSKTQKNSLIAMAQSPRELVFSTDDNGKVSLDEVDQTIEIFGTVDTSDKTNTWTFTLKNFAAKNWVLPDDKGITSTVGDNDALVSIDLTHFKHLTKKVRENFERENDDGGITKGEAMKLDTGLAYERRMGARGKMLEFGVLGNALISITGTGQEASGNMSEIRRAIDEQWATIETSQNEPRHIGTHDGYDMGITIHFHLVKAGGSLWSESELDQIEQIIHNSRIRYVPPRPPWKKQERVKVGSSPLPEPEKRTMMLFSKAHGLTGQDLKAQQALLAKLELKDSRGAAMVWRRTQLDGWLNWTP